MKPYIERRDEIIERAFSLYPLQTANIRDEYNRAIMDGDTRRLNEIESYLFALVESFDSE